MLACSTSANGVLVSSSIGVVGSYLPDGPQKDAVNELTTTFQTKFGYPPPQFAHSARPSTSYAP